VVSYAGRYFLSARTPNATRVSALIRLCALRADGPAGPDAAPKQLGYFARLGQKDANAGTYQRRAPTSYGGYSDYGEPTMDLPDSEVGRREIGSLYNPSELNWVDQDTTEPWVDFRDPQPDVTCKGKLQRRGFYKSTCELIDLDDLHFTVSGNIQMGERIAHLTPLVKGTGRGAAN